MNKTDRLYQEALKLDDKEKAILAVLLLESMDNEDAVEVEAAWAAEIERRVRDLEAGRAEMIPWEEVRARADAILNAHKKD